jgi:hypothetical protein
MVRRWRLIGYFLILYYPSHRPLNAVAHRMDPTARTPYARLSRHRHNCSSLLALFYLSAGITAQRRPQRPRTWMLTSVWNSFGGSIPSVSCSHHSAPAMRATSSVAPSTFQRCKKLRIVTCEGFGFGRSLTRPLRDARRFPVSHYMVPVPEATRTTLGFGTCPSFKDHLCRPRAKP